MRRAVSKRLDGSQFPLGNGRDEMISAEPKITKNGARTVY
jgi:hypothetical protein